MRRKEIWSPLVMMRRVIKTLIMMGERRWTQMAGGCLESSLIVKVSTEGRSHVVSQ